MHIYKYNFFYLSSEHIQVNKTPMNITRGALKLDKICLCIFYKLSQADHMVILNQLRFSILY